MKEQSSAGDSSLRLIKDLFALAVLALVCLMGFQLVVSLLSNPFIAGVGVVGAVVYTISLIGGGAK